MSADLEQHTEAPTVAVPLAELAALDTAVDKANAAGDNLSMDHLNAVYTAARDLMKGQPW